MKQPIHTPAFSEGSTVLDRLTGKTYTVAGASGSHWTIVVLPEPDADGCRVSMLPTDELEYLSKGTTMTTIPTIPEDATMTDLYRIATEHAASPRLVLGAYFDQHAEESTPGR